MRVALVGPPMSGKSTLFAAVAKAGGSNVDISRPDQPHLAVVKVPDDRLAWLSELYKPKKQTPAELEFIDLPGFDLSDQAGISRAKTHWATMRQSDMLVMVVDAFTGDSDPATTVGNLHTEMLFADLDQVTNRIERLTQAMRKPTGKQDQQARELDLMNRMSEALQADHSIAETITNETEAKEIRSFAFLSLKPTLVVTNCSESDAAQAGPETVGQLPCMQISVKIEEELAELNPDDRSEFLADLGIASPASDRLIRACYQQLKLVSFFTVGPDECRAWTIPAGTPAVEAAGEIHSDISRGFIRAETVAYDDLRAAGDYKATKAAGKVRLEGKTYSVQDGDIINFRFNV